MMADWKVVCWVVKSAVCSVDLLVGSSAVLKAVTKEAMLVARSEYH